MTVDATSLLTDENGRRLLAEAARNLAAGRSVDLAAWSSVRQACDDSRRSWFRRETTTARALGALARVLLAAEPGEARAAAADLPEGEPSALARAVAEAELARRAVETEPRSAAMHHRFALSVYALLPMIVGLSGYVSAHRTIIESLLRFFVCCADDRAIAAALSPASELTGAASQLAWKAGIAEHLEAASEMGERVLALHPRPQGRDGVGIWVICNNLQNIHAWWARDDPRRAVWCDEQRARLGAISQRALAGADATFDMLSLTLRRLAATHARLAVSLPALRQTHERQARSAMAAYGALSTGEGAPKDAPELAAQLERQLSSDATAWFTRSPRQAIDETQEVIARFETQARGLADAAIAESSPSRRRALVEQALDETFDALAEELAAVVRDAAIDHDVCRALLALGAIVDGRLGPCLAELTHTWTWVFPDPLPAPDTLEWRQCLSVSGSSDGARVQVWGRLVGLACLVETLRTRAGLRVSHLLRPRTVSLLERLLEDWGGAQRSRGAGRLIDADLAALAAHLSGAAVDSLEQAYVPPDRDSASDRT